MANGPTILYLIALAFALAGLFVSNGRDFACWAAGTIALALLWGVI